MNFMPSSLVTERMSVQRSHAVMSAVSKAIVKRRFKVSQRDEGVYLTSIIEHTPPILFDAEFWLDMSATHSPSTTYL